MYQTQTGGHCTALRRDSDSGAYVLATDNSGSSLPDTRDWIVAAYTLDDDELYHSTSLSAGSYAEALTRATREADAWQSVGDAPCPVNRRPQSTCPDTCDHGLSQQERKDI